MRILHLTSRLGIGGAETHIITLADGQRRLGHEVFCASAGGASVGELSACGVRHFTLPLDKRAPIAMFESAAGLLEIIREIKPDVIHAHSRIPAFIMRGISGEVKRQGALFVTSAHMPHHTNPAYRVLSEWGEGTVAVSRDIEEYLVSEYGVARSRIEVIENGIDTEKFRPRTGGEKKAIRASLGIEEDSLVIATASRTQESRAALSLWLCERAVEILGEGETLLLFLSGTVGRERDRLGDIKAKADEINRLLCRRAVVIVKGEADISGLLPAADIFVGVSRAALEAMSCGLATVIAGNEGYGGIARKENIAALRRANFTGRGGRADFEEIKKDLEELRRSEREGIGAECREYIKSELSSLGMARAVCRFYEKTKERGAKKRLLFVGNYGAGNYGDDVAASVISRELGEKYSLSFVSKNIKALSHSVGARGIRREDIRGIIREIKRSDCVIFGTGNIIQDDTSMRSLLYYKSIFDLARAEGKRVAFFSNGIGPLCDSTAEGIAARMLGTADYVSLREGESYDAVVKAKRKTPTYLGADIVYLSGKEKKQQPQPKVASGLFAYIGGRDYAVLCPRAATRQKDKRAIAEYFTGLQKKGIITVIIPLCPDKDTGVSRELASMIPDSCVYTGKLDGGRLEVLLRGAIACVGGRLHAGITAILSGCAFVGYDADRRISANIRHAGVGACLLSGELSCEDIERAVSAELRLAREGEYTRASERLQAEAEADIARLCEFVEGK